MCHDDAVEVEKLMGSSGDETGDDLSDLIRGNGDLGTEKSMLACGDGTLGSSSDFCVSTFSDFSVRRRRSAGFVLKFSGSISESDSVFL